jgi:hypothetical protein
MSQQVTDPTELPMRDLMMQFESLGQNCEFGIVQRAHKAEPLGLFRWGSISMVNLVRCLNDRFEGLGAPEAVKIRLANGEYMADETKYKISYHTFARDGEMPLDELHAREYKRLQYLAGKMLDDLEDAEKVFVYKRGEPLSEAEVQPLFRALRSYGDNKLLWVVPMDAEHPSGSIERVEDGLLRGYIDRFADPERVPSTTPVESWSALCTNAWRLLAGGGE